MSLPITPSSATPVTQNGNPLLKSGKADTKAEKFSFFDFLDVINPLQHIPIVNNIYREITGDKINNAARIAGGTLYGGMVGAALGIVGAVAVNETGQDVGGMAMTKMGLIHPKQDPNIETASAIPSPLPAEPALKDIPLVEITPADKMAKKDQINWDKPVEMASVPAAPVAMPTPQELNDIAPGSDDSQNDNPIDKQDVQKNMTEALAKYNAMQKVSDQAAPKPSFANLMSSPSTPVVENVAQQPSAQFKKLRRY